MRIEQLIISNLIFNEEFCRKAAPHIKPEYFHDRNENIIVKEILKFFGEYNKMITKDILKLELDKASVTDKELQELYSNVDEYKKEDIDMSYLVNATESFCLEKSSYNGILKCIKIMEGKDKDHSISALPKILQDALNVSFDSNVGHDYILNVEERFDFYRRTEDKIPFNLTLMDKIASGGMSRKSLIIVLAQTGAGKTLFMCHTAASALKHGRNVLYITAEMAAEKIAERIDANILNITMDELKTIDKESYMKRFQKIAGKSRGRLIIKEYPTASAHSGHFRALLEELKVKKDFTPDLVIVDYLNICASARLKMGSSVNSYSYIKSIAEELRGLAVEYNVPILSATQTNRSGFNNSDIELTDTSESIGLPATCDLMFALIRSEELDELNQLMIKQLKNRYADPSIYKRFVLGVDRSKMKLFDVEDSAQKDVADSGIPTNTTNNTGWNLRTKDAPQKKFGDFKY